METKKTTIKDIARLTGLSKGTVDRVLHNREGVSKKSYAKVMEVIKNMGYEPNVYASLLAQKKVRTIVVLLPKYEPGEFWELTEEGIAESAESAGNLGVKVVRLGYDQYDIESFRDACKKTLALEPSGVVLAPMFKNETLVFVDRLNTLGIPFVYIDTKLESNSYLAYFGMPIYQSGYLCAHILTDEQNPEEVAIIRIQRDKFGKSDPTINRREGFMDYITEHFPACTTHNLVIDPNKPKEIEATLEQFFAAHPGIRHIAMFNSRIHLITSFLAKHPEKKYRVVGFDNLAANVKALKSGLVTCLIAQRPGDQARKAISALTDLLVFGREPSTRDNFMPMDVLTRYNAEYY